MTSRISWTQVCLDLIEDLAERSSDDKVKVGCAILSISSKTPVAFGYNGSAPKTDNSRESLDVGRSGFLHAEENALMAAQSRFVAGDHHVMFCTHEPCDLCAKRILRSNQLHPLSPITQVVYLKPYWDPFREERNLPRGQEILDDNGVIARQIRDVDGLVVSHEYSRQLIESDYFFQQFSHWDTRRKT